MIKIKIRHLLLVIVSWLLIFVWPAEAARYYVATTGSNTNPGTSERPWRGISYAARRVSAGDTVVIRGGTYEGTARLTRSGTPDNPIIFRGQRGERPIIMGSGDGSENGLTFAQEVGNITIRNIRATNWGGYAIFLAGNNERLKLVNIEGDNSGTGLRIYSAQHVTITGSAFHDNVGVGIDVSPGPGWIIRIDNTRADDNTGFDWSDGFAFETGGDIQAFNCRARRNDGDGFDSKVPGTDVRRLVSEQNSRDGIKLWGADSRLVNSISEANGLAGVVLAEGGSFTVANNLIIQSALVGGYGMYVAYDPSLAATHASVFNNVFAFNGGGVHFGPSVVLDREDHNLYWSRIDSEISTANREYSREELNNGAWKRASGLGRGSFSAAPQFVDRAVGDYHLKAGSPAVGAGSPAGAPLFDFDGRRRPAGNAIDAGPYER